MSASRFVAAARASTSLVVFEAATPVAMNRPSASLIAAAWNPLVIADPRRTAIFSMDSIAAWFLFNAAIADAGSAVIE
jgi:hypothetical protein